MRNVHKLFNHPSYFVDVTSFSVLLYICITALYRDDETEAYYAGIVAEAPNGRNELR